MRLTLRARTALLSVIGLLLMISATARAGTVETWKASAGGGGDMNPCPYLFGPADESAADRGPAEAATTPALVRHGFGNDQPFDGSPPPEPGLADEPAKTGYFLPLDDRSKSAFEARFALRRAASESGATGADGRASDASAGPGGTASVPLPPAALLTPPCMLLAAFATRRLRRHL